MPAVDALETSIAYARLAAAGLLTMKAGKLVPDYGPVKSGAELAKYQDEISYWAGGDKGVTCVLASWLGGAHWKDAPKACAAQLGVQMSTKDADAFLAKRNKFFAALVNAKATAKATKSAASVAVNLEQDKAKAAAEAAKVVGQVGAAAGNAVGAAGNVVAGAGGLLLWLSQNPVIALALAGAGIYGARRLKLL